MDGWAQHAPGVTVWTLALLLVLFLTIPIGALVVRAVAAEEGWDSRTYDILRQALGLSLATTALAMVVVIVSGTPLAYLLARRRFRGAAAVEALVDLPIVLPPAVAGIALLVAFGRKGLVGQWLAEGGVTLGFTTIAVVMAQVFVSAPFYVIAARAGFARVDRDVEAAAADLGRAAGTGVPDGDAAADRTQPHRRCGAGLGAGARRVRGDDHVRGQFPGVTQTMPLAIYARFGAGDMPAALLLSVVLLVASLTVLLGVRIVGVRVRGGF